MLLLLVCWNWLQLYFVSVTFQFQLLEIRLAVP